MKLRILCFGTMKLLFFLGVFRLVAPLYIKTKEPYNFANNRPETIDDIHVQNQKDLVGARYDHNTEQNNANYRKQNTTSQENNEVKDFSESTKKWKQNKTMLEKFYDYIKKERDSLEKQLESTDFKEDKAVMKIPRKKYQSKKGKETSNKSKRDVSSNNGIDSSKNIHHISKIKEEIAKLQDLVTILRDQQQIINLLDDMKANGTNTIQEHQQAKVDVVQKSNFSVFTKELNDLKHYVKQFLVDKLEKEIQSRTEEGNSFNKALQSQQIIINNMKKLIGQIIKSNHNSNGQINNDLQVETTKDIIGELRNLEKHISEIMNQQSAPKETILGVKTPIANNQHNTPNISSKIRSSFLEDLLDDEPIKKSDDSGSEALLKILQRQLDDDDDKPSQRSETSVKKLLKLVDDAKKKKKEKDFLKKLVKTIGDKPEDRNLKIDDDLDDKLSFLKDEIDQLKPKDDDEDFEERKFGDALKKLLSQAKPGVTKHPNTNKVDSLRKKLLEVMKQPTPQRIYHHPQSSYNLCNCKPVHPYNYPQKPISSPYPYFGQLNPGLNQNYGAPPHNIQQNNFDQFGYNFDPQLFQDAPSQHYQSQPTYTGPYTQEYPDNSSPYFNGGQRENLQSQIDGLQNIINDLNNPGHIPKVDDTANLYNLNQQITDLKNVGNNLDVNNNQYSNSDYQAVQKDGYQLSGTPNSGQTQEYASNPNIPAAAPQNPTYRSSANEETLEESKPVSPKKLKNKTQNRNKRSTEDTLEDLLHRILKEEIDNEDYNTDEQNNHNLRRENELADSIEDDDQNIDGGRTSFNFSGKKKISIFDKILDKILNKIVIIVQKIVPKLFSKLFNLKSLFGIDLFGSFDNFDNYNYDKSYSPAYQNNYDNNDMYAYQPGGIKSIRNFGLLGIIPMFILKLVSFFKYFLGFLQKSPFINNFLIPGFVVLAVAGLTVFLIWWLQPNKDYQYNNQIGYYPPDYRYSRPAYRPNFNNYNNGYPSNYQSYRSSNEHVPQMPSDYNNYARNSNNYNYARNNNNNNYARNNVDSSLAGYNKNVTK